MHTSATVLEAQYSYKMFWIFHCLWAETVKMQAGNFFCKLT